MQNVNRNTAVLISAVLGDLSTEQYNFRTAKAVGNIVGVVPSVVEGIAADFGFEVKERNLDGTTLIATQLKNAEVQRIRTILTALSDERFTFRKASTIAHVLCCTTEEIIDTATNLGLLIKTQRGTGEKLIGFAS